jgi:REP-associated tyrosine transposase
MAHTYSKILVHCVFSTKERRQFPTLEVQQRLWPFICGVARKHRIGILAVGGVADHVHLLLSLPTDVSIAKAMQHIKGASSKWIHENFRSHREFSWQEGYGAFGIGVSGKEETIQYIRSQAEHHKRASFEDEFIAFLKKHSIDYDTRYVFG